MGRGQDGDINVSEADFPPASETKNQEHLPKHEFQNDN
jgi:hypothetical protein